METENIQSALVENCLNTPIGSEEKPRLAAKEVKVVSIGMKEVPSKKNPKATLKKVVLACKHPDRNETINISDVKYVEGDVLKVNTCWFFTDSKGEIQKDSALANLLRFYEVGTLSELSGRSLKTIEDSKGYLCLRAY